MLTSRRVQLLCGSPSTGAMSVYSRFSEDEKTLYFGSALGAVASFNDKNALPMDVEIQRRAFLVESERCAEVPVAVSCGTLNANLPCQESLFNVTCVTLPVSNVTKITLKRLYCD